MPPPLQPSKRIDPEPAAPADVQKPLVHIVPPLPRNRPREISVIGLTPQEQEVLTRHNLGIGGKLQRFTMRFVFLVALAPLGMVLMRVFFRVRAENAARLDVLKKSSGIFAIRHFYEMDPFVPFYAAAWGKAVRRWHMVAYSLASRAWTRSPILRGVSWGLGVMGLSRGLGLKQSATERAVEILNGSELACAAIYPTGPIGDRKAFTLGPGIGYIAMHCPDVPVVPVTIRGLQEFRWRDVLLLRRPLLRVAICRPFYGREVLGAVGEPRADRICDLVADRWDEEEHRMSGGTLEGTRV